MAGDILSTRLESIVRDVVLRAVRAVDPDRIWLFGSQARATATRASDVDVAFELSAAGRSNWPTFVAEAADEIPALIDIDFVDLASCPPHLAAEIRKTGRVIYERSR